ncbi:lipid A biosynthesis lauroyl acyltransferase [Cocleimonas flava]|uniref:KDO2-lipid IV(A) lauroyltransferase n=1 Tax=Cocleimonas flava TaxID=634765 RepID=A0A4R1EV29_9GAMM|nr:LpxL/LpxP family Kdo(2)-lipid IV(A) lauroyl/palmitoleoyl acyltransferase [Cocleimonas flava]TCJ82978.1 KDO2-lipid IV(A) lauroyltransferase [Cocleimonas flava]
MPSKFFHPRYWPTWLGVGILKLIVHLPWRWQMALGKWLGVLIYHAAKTRREISHINLEIAFPELSKTELEALNRDHFISMGQGLIEAALGWWGSDEKIKKLAHVEDFHHLREALKDGNVIMLGAHFSSLEVGGRIMALEMPLHVTYRPHQNALIEHLVAVQRDTKYGKAIPKSNIRDMIKSIKNGAPVWYATDQNYRGKGSLPVPFFGVDAPTNTGTARLAKMTNAKVIPCITVRLTGKKDDRQGYLIKTYPPLDNFPSDDALRDTTRLNQILEELIKEYPDQYLWTHKRYKNYKTTNKDFYKEYAKSHQSGHKP